MAKSSLKNSWRTDGLRVEMDLAASPALASPEKWFAPPYIDLRPYCLPAEDQGGMPACAGFAACGLAEVRAWRRTHVPRQFDAIKCYREAKRLDGDANPGTSLQQAARAASNLGFIGKIKALRTLTNLDQVLFALHRDGVCLLGFETTYAWQDVRPGGWIRSGVSQHRGPHAVLGCYFDADGIGFQNSWHQWGVAGFGRLRWEDARRTFLYGIAVEEVQDGQA
jgi:hypothetical protein